MTCADVSTAENSASEPDLTASMHQAADLEQARLDADVGNFVWGVNVFCLRLVAYAP